MTEDPRKADQKCVMNHELSNEIPRPPDSKAEPVKLVGAGYQLHGDADGKSISSWNLKLMDMTLTAAFKTYSNVTTMSNVMFYTGIGMFLFAGILSAVFKESFYGFVLGGLGTADFVAWFMYKPMDKSQQALSDLIQAIIIYQNYYNQERMWERVGPSERGATAIDVARIREASSALHLISSDCVELCQKYIEDSQTPIAGQAPTAPQTLTATTPDIAQVALDWKAPSSSGGSVITNYKVYRGTTSGSENLLTTVGNVLNYIDKSINNNQTYYYMISAVNSVGESPRSNEVFAAPKQAS